MSAVDEYRASDLWNVTLPETTDRGTLYRPGVPVVRKSLADAAIAELTSECGVRANEASGFRTRIAELEAELANMRSERVMTKKQLHLTAYKLEQAEAELAALKRRHQDAMSCIPESVQVHLRNRWAERGMT